MRPDLEILTKLVDDVWELVFGTERRPQTKEALAKKPKRARGDYGRFKADDKSTPNVNEAWVDGKAPKRGKNDKR